MNKKKPPRRRSLAALAAGALAVPLAAVGAGTAQAQETGVDLTDGAVFAMSNARDGNTVVAYDRAPDGSLSEVGRFGTGGAGSGSFEDSSNGLVLTTASGEISPNNLVEPSAGTGQVLLATNAGSDTVSTFRVGRDSLDRVDVQDSGGAKPVSVTANDGLVYVLNSGETTDELFDADGNVIPNCTTGHDPVISGFTMSDDGQLTPIPGSTRKLSGESVSGCAQLSFDPSGSVLVVTERLAQPQRLDQQRSDNERIDDEGVIDTFQINASGRPGRKQVIDATGQGPFGFTFAKNGSLLTTEQFDGPAGPGRGAATSYRVADDASLISTAPSLHNGGTDTCWFVATDDGSLGFTTSFFQDGRISSYGLDDDGIDSLIDPVATSASDDATDDDVAMGASDLALSRDSDYLYQLNSVDGTVTTWKNDGDGTLTKVERKTPFPQPQFGPGGGMAAPIGLAAS